MSLDQYPDVYLWCWLVRGFDTKGHLLVETVHKGDTSKDMEVDVWKTRMKRGEVGRIEVVDRRTCKMETIYS